MRMKVILEVDKPEQIEAIMKVININNTVQIVEKPEKKEVIIDNIKKEKSLADIKAAYYADKARKKEEREKEISQQIAEAQERMEPEKKRGRPKKNNALPEDIDTRILDLVDTREMSFSEIGRMFGVSYKTISTRYWKMKGAES